MPNSKLHIQYGDGSTTDGAVFKDVVSVAGFQADQQTFGAADALASEWNTDPMDGILGMAYESISQLETPPFFQTVSARDSHCLVFSLEPQAEHSFPVVDTS